MKRTFLLLSLVSGVCMAQGPLIYGSGADEVHWARIETGNNSPITDSGVYVIKTAQQFHDYLAKLDELDLKRPNIDWTKYQIVAVHMQGLTDSGQSFRVKRLHIAAPGKVDVEVIVTGPQTPGIDFPVHNKVAAKYQYPYFILETSQMDAKWSVRIVTPDD